jgi:hypothetical protein
MPTSSLSSLSTSVIAYLVEEKTEREIASAIATPPLYFLI